MEKQAVKQREIAKLPRPWRIKQVSQRKTVRIKNTINYLMRGDDPILILENPYDRESILKDIEMWDKNEG